MVSPGIKGGGALWEIEDLGVHIGTREILAPLTLSLAAGQVYGLIGPNGSGKSTLLKILARQFMPGRGIVRFEGVPLGNRGGRAFSRKVAYMPSSPASRGDDGARAGGSGALSLAWRAGPFRRGG